ncbi:MAG: hypothetical protein GEU74_16875, partial [Nitriliruptorales bacterium]|nr:hypothetical protein [Nitriliruptorales bacterium]
MSTRILGPRQARRARLRRRRRRRGLVAFFLAIAVLAGLVVAGAWPGRRTLAPSADVPAEQATTAGTGEQDTLLLVRHGRDEGPALGVTLLAAQPRGRSTVLFIPVGTLVDIPGFGFDQLGLTFQYGGAALLEASVENLLGVDVDHVASASQSGLGALLGRTGGLELELDERLVRRSRDGTGEVRFEPGTQFLDGERLVEYWSFRQRDEQEVATFPRQQLVWATLLDSLDDEDVVDALVSDGAPQLQTSAEPRFLRSMLVMLARARGAEKMEFTLLPVTPFGSDGGSDDTYRATPEGIRRLAEGPLAPSVPTGGGAEAL